MYIADTVGFYAVLIYATWLFFLAAESLYSAKLRGTLGRVAFFFGAPILGVMVTLDFLLNLAATPVFLQLPQWWLLTQRCDAAISLQNPTGLDHYRQTLANWICRNLLNPFQVGGHCHKE